MCSVQGIILHITRDAEYIRNCKGIYSQHLGKKQFTSISSVHSEANQTNYSYAQAVKTSSLQDITKQNNTQI